MKKILLATALAVVSLTGVKAESTPAGNGFYVAGQVGGGALLLSGEADFYKIEEGVLKKIDGTDGVEKIPFGGVQFNWGYSHLFSNNMTLGFEAALISPGLRLGYMINEKHHIAVGFHSALIIRTALGLIIDAAEKNLSATQKENFDLKLDNFSGFGPSISYEYFTASKNFFRTQLRGDYYGVEGKVAGIEKLENTLLPFAVNGKGSVWDITFYVGFGSQW